MCIDPVLDLLIKKYYTVFVCSEARGADSDCKKEGTKNEHKSDPEKNQE